MRMHSADHCTAWCSKLQCQQAKNRVQCGCTLLINAQHSVASCSANKTDRAACVNGKCPVHEKCYDAGAISTEGGVTVLTANQFINNTAASHGGAVAYTDDCFTVSDTSGVVMHL